MSPARPIARRALGSSLRSSRFPRDDAHQVRILRSQLSPIRSGCVDSHEAYVSRVLLNIYGGPGVTNVWTDDLKSTAMCPPVGGNERQRAAGAAAAGCSEAEPPACYRLPASRASRLPVAGPPEPSAPREVKLAGSVLKINDYPIFPRASNITASGWLSSSSWASTRSGCGQVPTPAFLWPKPGSLACGCLPAARATRRQQHGGRAGVRAGAGLGPGPRPDGRDAGRQPAAGGASAAGRFAVLPAADLLPEQQFAELQPARLSDLLLIDRRPLGTSLEMPDYGNWVRRQPLLAAARHSASGPRCKRKRAKALRQLAASRRYSDSESPVGGRSAAVHRRGLRSRSGCWFTRPSPPAAADCCSFPTRRWRPRTANPAAASWRCNC